MANTRPARAQPEPAAVELPAVPAPQPEKPPTVKIGCRLVNGVQLRLFSPFTDADTALSVFREDSNVTIAGTHADTDSTLFWGEKGGAAAVTSIPRAFWEQWRTVNADSPLLGNGIIFEIEDPPQPATPEGKRR